MRDWNTIETYDNVMELSCAKTSDNKKNLSCWINRRRKTDKVEFPKYVNVSNAKKLFGDNKNEEVSRGGLNKMSSFKAKFNFGKCELQKENVRFDRQRRLVCDGSNL